VASLVVRQIHLRHPALADLAIDTVAVGDDAAQTA
jgi:hypothetical protein